MLVGNYVCVCMDGWICECVCVCVTGSIWMEILYSEEINFISNPDPL